ncbi:MAG TPA: hypothetical protein EYH12_00910 [Psychromonas hadalis]|nr:hypothetical protein [Psychromonas hadalis]
MALLADDHCAVSFLPMKRRTYSESKIKLFMLGHVDLGFYCGKNSVLLKASKLTATILRTHLQLVSENMQYSELAYLQHASNTVVVPNNPLICEMLSKVGWAVLPKSAAQQGGDKGELVRMKLDFATENSFKITFASCFCESGNRGPAMTYLLEKIAELGEKYFC